MTLQETVKDDMVKAMKAKDPFKVGILRVVMSDFSRIKKNVGPDKKISDKQALQCIRASIKGAEDILDNPFHKTKSEKEIAILSAYLPVMLSEDQIEEIAKGLIKDNGFSSMREMGTLMGLVKGHPDGALIDGKLSSDIVKRLLK